MVATRIVHNADAMVWLQAQGKLVGASIVTSLPDVSELPHLGLDAWRRWFEDAAALVMECTSDQGVAIFFQSDIKHGGFWIDKGALVSRAAERARMSCLFHKIVCRKPPGSSSFGRATYAHMLGFARGQPRRQKQERVDVLPDGGFQPGTPADSSKPRPPRALWSIPSAAGAPSWPWPMPWVWTPWEWTSRLACAAGQANCKLNTSEGNLMPYRNGARGVLEDTLDAQRGWQFG